MANSSFTKGTIETPVSPEHGGTGLSTLGTAGQTQVVNEAGTALEWGSSGHEGVDTYTASTPAFLTCGEAGAIANFQSLQSGDNDGAFKSTIDGVVYEIGIDLKAGDGTSNLHLNFDNGYSGVDFLRGESFEPASDMIMSSIKVEFGAGSSGSRTIEFRLGRSTGGTLLGTATATVSMGFIEFTFSSPINLSAGQAYTFLIQEGNTGLIHWMGTRINYYGLVGGGWQVGYHLNFEVWGPTTIFTDQYSELVTLLQQLIRAETGGSEVVEYDTDHFVITSGIGGTTSEVSQLTAPDTGTDVTGASYLNGATGTATAGTGNNGKVALLNDDGKISGGLVEVGGYTEAITETDDATAGRTTTITCGFRIKKVSVTGFQMSGAQVMRSSGGVDEAGNNSCIWMGPTFSGRNTDYCLYTYVNTNFYTYVTINNITDTGFDYVIVKKGDTIPVQILIEAS